MVDFVKKNKADSIHFTSFEGSRTRLYTTLTKLWANKLGWNHEIEYDPEYEDMKGAASFIISKTKFSPTQKALENLDGKGKVQQAKVKFSKNLKGDLEKNPNYNKFRDLIAKEKLFHGGSVTLGDFNAVWFVTGDVKGAYSYAVENDNRVYSVEAKDLKDAIIIPDMNDAKGFYEYAKEKYPDQIDAIQNRVYGSNRLVDGVDIKRVLKQPNASEILNEFIDWSQDNFNMGAFPLGDNIAIDSIYDGKSITKGLPVIVVNRPSNWESNPKLVTEVKMADVYRQEKAQEKIDAKKKKIDARKESWRNAVQKSFKCSRYKISHSTS